MAADEFLKQERGDSPDSIETGYFAKRKKKFNEELAKGIQGTKPKTVKKPAKKKPEDKSGKKED